MTRISQPRAHQSHIDQRHNGGPLRSRIVQTSVAVLLAGGMTAGLVGVSAAQAQPTVTRKATVVKVVTGRGFGRMLATIHGRSLYIKPHGTCTGSCLQIWPPLLMPRGKTIPLGARCLGTARFGHRLQVTYRGHRLYLFINDHRSSVLGDGQAGFKVAKVIRRPCPA